MKYETEDTIVAIATPNTGEGGIGIVRLSGRDSVAISDKIFRSKAGDKPSQFESHSIHYGWIVDGNKRIDEVLLSVMKSPKTYTREDIVEISGHGGPAVLRKLLELCLSSGARLAEPGEFTKRAFLKGRIDLAQAEAVCELIRAKTGKSAELAVEHVKGKLSEKIKEFRNQLVSLIAKFEAELDYSEEAIKFVKHKDARGMISGLLKQIQELILLSDKNRIYVEGVKIAIVGRPNVGKSSLFNAVLSKERAIVTALPGTTRDIITETFNLKGIPVTIMDTAGIMLGRLSGEIEKISTRNSKKIIAIADLVLFVADVSKKFTKDDLAIVRLISTSRKKTVIVLNKIDLLKKSKKKNLEKEITKKFETLFKKPIFQNCSALQNSGISELEGKIYKLILKERGGMKAPDTAEAEFVVNLRQEQVLKKAAENLKNAAESVNKNESCEFVVLSLHSALDNLGEITGETTTEEILDVIFSNFCVGK